MNHEHRQATAAARAAASQRLVDAYSVERPDPQKLERRAGAQQPGDAERIAELHRLDAAGLLTATARTSLGHLEAARDAGAELEQLRKNSDDPTNPREDS